MASGQAAVLNAVRSTSSSTRRYKIAQVREAFAAMEKGELARGVITF